jgi:hypothetical protein
MRNALWALLGFSLLLGVPVQAMQRADPCARPIAEERLSNLASEPVDCAIRDTALD